MGKTNKRNIKLIIEYDGTDYCGWQSQKSKHKTIQETISKAIRKITNQKVILYGAGRTDSGVHAIGQTANFLTSSKIPVRNLQRGLNSCLPKDVVIRKASLVPISCKISSAEVTFESSLLLSL